MIERDPRRFGVKHGKYSDIIAQHLEIEDMRRDAYRTANLLHEDVNNTPVSFQQEVRQQILEVLNGSQLMIERFSVLIDPDTAPYVGSVDLSRVQYPATHRDYHVQKDEYREFRDLIQSTAYSRYDPEGKILYTPPALFCDPETGKEMAFVERTRVLAALEDGDRTIKIRKRTSFLVSDLSRFGEYDIDANGNGFNRPRKTYQLDQEKIQGALDSDQENALHTISNIIYAYAEHS